MTHAEASISRDDADYLDIDGAKEALQAFRVSNILVCSELVINYFMGG